MERHPRQLTKAETKELEGLCEITGARPLTFEEGARCYELQGFSREDAEVLAAAGGRPIVQVTFQ
jgi:hypothetical protein